MSSSTSRWMSQGGEQLGRDLDEAIRFRLNSWDQIGNRIRTLQVVLTLAGIVCPLIVAAFADSLPTLLTRILSFAAAASVAVFSAFELGRVATRFREAWKLLNGAFLEYEQGILDAQGLVEAYRRGEQVIGQLKADPFGPEGEPKSY